MSSLPSIPFIKSVVAISVVDVVVIGWSFVSHSSPPLYAVILLSTLVQPIGGGCGDFGVIGRSVSGLS